MATSLYLDTARLGQMSCSAQLAHIDFVRLAGEEAGSLYFDDFLRHGFQAWPAALQQRFSGLTGWQGVGHLKTDLKRLAGTEENSRVLLANRTSQLMRFAARLFFGPCRNVLVTDLTWPSYEQILIRQARKSGNRLTRLRVRSAILRGRLSADEFIEQMADTFRRHGCDGLFLPAVDNWGIRLPVEELVGAIRRRAELRFVVIDGAQTFCHVPVKFAGDCWDLFIAGCHKWLRGYHPMGLCFAGRPGSLGYIESMLDRLVGSGQLDDPLLAFTEAIQHGRESPFGETVNLAPLFSTRGAVDDLLPGEHGIGACFTRRLANAKVLVELAERSGWSALRPQATFRTGVVVLQSPNALSRMMAPDELRRLFMRCGIAVTAYPHGQVRLSMPARQWKPAELDLLRSAFRRTSQLKGIAYRVPRSNAPAPIA